MQSQFGRYEVLRKIASGGMATVYLGRLAKEGGFERLVALKVMHQHIAADPNFVNMFLDEARLAARIRHPNVVSTVDIETSEQTMVLVMDYVDGPSLHRIREELSKRGARIPLPIVLRIFLDVLSGLQGAHEVTDADGKPLNLVHRDVSPQDILVGRDGLARLTDFGVARAESRLSSTRGDQLKGNLPYIPPEQILDDVVTRKSDLYSLGVSLWEAIVGLRLFHAENTGKVVHDILEGERPRPTQHVPCPAAVEEVVMRALARDPAERYDQASEMAQALEQAAHDAGVRVASSAEVGSFVAKKTGGEGGAALVGETARAERPVEAVSDPPLGENDDGEPSAGGGVVPEPPSEPAAGVGDDDDDIVVSWLESPVSAPMKDLDANGRSIASLEEPEPSYEPDSGRTKRYLFVAALVALLAGASVAVFVGGQADVPAPVQQRGPTSGHTPKAPPPAQQNPFSAAPSPSVLVPESPQSDLEAPKRAASAPIEQPPSPSPSWPPQPQAEPEPAPEPNPQSDKPVPPPPPKGRSDYGF